MSPTPESPAARRSIRRPVLLGLFTGTAVGAGYLLAGVPNVELMSLLVALAGGTLGAASGAVCGVLAALLYSLGSPYGAPVPLLLVAQAVGFAAMGTLGHLVARPTVRLVCGATRWRATVLCATVGLLGTLGYEILTNLAILGAFDLEPRVVLFGAVPFLLIHCGVNAAAFGLLLPPLMPRLVGLAEAPLRARSGGSATIVALLLLAAGGAQAAPDAFAAAAGVDSTAAAAGDSTVAARADTVVPGTNWTRPLWRPMLGTLPEELLHRSAFLPVQAGGLGAPLLVLGVGSTSRAPTITWDGIPLGTGHALADDPWLVPLQGATFTADLYRADDWGAGGGRIDLTRSDPDPERAISQYRGRKGPHESYLRGVSLLTPDAEWRLGYDFEESLDNEGYNWTELPGLVFDPNQIFIGHAKLRRSRFTLTRRVTAASRLTLHYINGRKTRNTPTVWGAEHQERWDQAIAVRATGRDDAWRWDTRWFWNDRDVLWGDRAAFAGTGEELRRIESAREGGSAEIARATPLGEVRLQARGENWVLEDSGGDGFAAAPGELRGAGQRGRVGLGWSRTLGGQARVDLQGGWNVDSRLTPATDLQLLAEAPAGAAGWRWRAGLARDGRAPRSDEWLTPVSRDLDGRRLELLPSADLRRERGSRAWVGIGRGLLGIDLAAEVGWTRLRDGIAWLPSAGDPDVGSWSNGLELDAQRVQASLRRQGRLWGVYRISLESTWQKFDESGLSTPFLPPERLDRLQVFWENHLFREDGIVEVAWLTVRRGEMPDPWDVSRSGQLASATLHDLILGFRLVGAHISLALRNLTGERAQLTTGVLGPGLEREMRLVWLFRH